MLQSSSNSSPLSSSSQPHQTPIPLPKSTPPFPASSTFTLSCNHQNQTTIHFHGSNVDLLVKAIAYDTRRLSLEDPRNCVHGVFLNLNLSLTPFTYYHDVRDYKYVNCSEKLVGNIEEVPCLSGYSHHVYVVEPSLPLPAFCSAVKTVAIPFSYSAYLSDSSFGLGLTWASIAVEEAEYNYRVLYVVLSIMVVVFIVGKLLYAKYGGDFYEEKVEEMLGEYEALRL